MLDPRKSSELCIFFAQKNDIINLLICDNKAFSVCWWRWCDVVWSKAPEQLLNGSCGQIVFSTETGAALTPVKTSSPQRCHLHGLCVLLGVVGLGGGGVGEGVLCDHGHLGGSWAIGVVVPLLWPLVLIVAMSWLGWILWWHRGDDGTTFRLFVRTSLHQD